MLNAECRMLNEGVGFADKIKILPQAILQFCILHFAFCILLNKAVVQYTDGRVEVPVIYAEDDIQLIGALVDHADIDARFAQGGEDLAGNAGPVGNACK